MSLITHFLNTIRHTLRSNYPYSKLKVTFDYTILILRSVAFHKFNLTNARSITFLGLKIHFNNFNQVANLLEEIFIFQEYSFRTKNTKPFLIDVGSNIGLSVLYFKKLFPESTITAFEPDPAAFELLQKNIDVNHLKNVAAHNYALANTSGEITLYTNANRSGFLSIAREGVGTTVRAKKLSDMLAQKVDFIKIDVEGSEIDIIDDLISTGKIGNIEQMVIEYHPHITNIPVGNFISKIEGSGFKCSSKQSSFRPRAKSWLINCVRV